MRVQPDYRYAPRYALPALPDRHPASDRTARGTQPGGVRVPGRVDHRLAGATGASGRDPGSRLVGGPVARPDPRRGRDPRRQEPLGGSPRPVGEGRRRVPNTAGIKLTVKIL